MLSIVTRADLSSWWIPQAKIHLGIEPDENDHDQVVERALRAAIEFVEKRTSRALVPTTYVWSQDYWQNEGPCAGEFIGACVLALPRGPVRDVIEVSYLDEDHAEQIVAEADYTWQARHDGAEIVFDDDFTEPSLSTRPGAVRVQFDAGYDDPATSGSGDDPNLHLPAQAELAVMMLTAHWFQHRGDTDADVERAAAALIGNLKIFR